MLGGLYGDLPKAKDEESKEGKNAPQTGGWSKTTLIAPPPKPAPGKPLKWLQGWVVLGYHYLRDSDVALRTVLLPLAAAPAFIPPSLVRAQTSKTASTAPKPAARPASNPGASASASGAEPAAPIHVHAQEQGPSLFAADADDEYDPMNPNDYLDILRGRETALRQALEVAERQVLTKEEEARRTEDERRRQEAGADDAGEPTRFVAWPIFCTRPLSYPPAPVPALQVRASRGCSRGTRAALLPPRG